MDAVILIGIITALLVGLGAGWFMGARKGEAGSETAKETANMLRNTLDGVTAERDAQKAKLENLSGERAELASELAALKAAQAERDRAQDEKIAALQAFKDEANEQMSAKFAEISHKALGDAQDKFLQRADERFNQAGEKNEAKLKELLSPVGEKLKAYEEQVDKVEKERSEAYGNLTGLIGEMKQGQEKVQSEAAKLVNSLRNAPKARGRWGEQQLKNVLESCGLSEHVDFVTEQSVTTEDGRLRPDAVLRVPGGRSLVIDAKVSLNAYQDAFEADDEAARDAAMAQHCHSMKTHIDGLSRKAYWDQFDDAPDYVIMFVPGEHFLAAALEYQPDLWDFAFEKKVLLATPTNLVAIARTVAGVWRQEKMAEQALEINRHGKDLYDRLAVAAEHLKRMGGGLSSAVTHYNKFVGSFERNVLSSGRRFKEMNVETGKKEIEDIPALDSLPRYGSEAEQALIEDDGETKSDAREAAE